MSFLLKKMVGKMMTEVSLGLKYYVETGNEVTKKNIKKIVKAYKINEANKVTRFTAIKAA